MELRAMDQKYMAIILTNYLKNQGAHPKQNQNQHLTRPTFCDLFQCIPQSNFLIGLKYFYLKKKQKNIAYYRNNIKN